jgi:hypothetical protein
MRVREYRPQEAAQHLVRAPRIPSTAIRKRIGEREHPLPDGHFGEDAMEERLLGRVAFVVDWEGAGGIGSEVFTLRKSRARREQAICVVATNPGIRASSKDGRAHAAQASSSLALREPASTARGSLPLCYFGGQRDRTVHIGSI